MATKEEIRNLLIQEFKQSIKEQPPRSMNLYTLCEVIGDKTSKDTPSFLRYYSNHTVFEIIYEWMRAGILFFGHASNPNSTQPHITLTTFGKECIETGNFLPYDPDGYVRELQHHVPQIDDVTLQYVRESIATYNSEHLLSSTITLGVASENIILNLIDIFINAFTDTTKKDALQRRMEGKGIFQKYNLFIDELQKLNAQPHKKFAKELEANIDQLFHFIRNTRNQSGHPTGKAVSKKVAYSNLQIFAEYSKTLFEAMNWLQHNQINY